MSGMRHPTISAWQRHEDGSYAAEVDGWNLRVEWRPEGTERHEGRRGFTWAAERGGIEVVGEDLFEEMEVAMARAEEHAAPADAETEEPAADAAPAADAHGHH
jgi:hypothetical protein